MGHQPRDLVGRSIALDRDRVSNFLDVRAIGCGQAGLSIAQQISVYPSRLNVIDRDPARTEIAGKAARQASDAPLVIA